MDFSWNSDWMQNKPPYECGTLPSGFCFSYKDEDSLNFLCPEIHQDDTEDLLRTLHRESKVDVSVVENRHFGKVVRKTYLHQTVRRPSRNHSCLQDQLKYEAAIMKSLSTVDSGRSYSCSRLVERSTYLSS
eukprot:s1390_g11.t1